MRFWFFCVTFVLGLSATAAAQPAPSDTQPLKYGVFFADKPADASKAPAVEIADEALERRALRARRASGWYDTPVAPSYVEALRTHGAEPLVQSRWLNAVSVLLTPAQVDQVQALPFVKELRLVGQRIRPVVPEAPPPPAGPSAFKATMSDYGLSDTQLAVMNAIAPLEAGINGAGVILGFLDTEFGEFAHPVFAHLHEDNRLLGYMNFAQGPQGSRHGLSVASVAVGFEEGNLVGPAHGASVLAATTEYAPTETNQEEDNLVAGLEWMEAEGADVVNISLGYTEFDAGENSYTYEDLDGDTGTTTRAVDIAAGLGVIVVTSAGNEGNGAWQFIGTPADADSVIVVGAVQADSVRASFSSVGPTADGRTKPDVAAMGRSVYIAGNSGYGFSSGTSFSSPLVAGVVCQILQVNPTLGPIEVRDLLRSTASQFSNPDNELGWGIVNAAAAIAAADAATDREDADEPRTSSIPPPHPNPFTDRTTFEIKVPTNAGKVRLSVFNVLGQEVRTIALGNKAAGVHEFTLDARGLTSGVYVYRVEAGDFSASKRMILVE